MNLPAGAKTRLGKGWLHGEIAYSPDGTRLAVTSTVGVWLYDTHTWREVALFTGQGISRLRPLIFSPDGQTLAGASGKGVHLWDVNTGQLKATWLMSRTSGWIESLAFSPDGTILAVGEEHDYGEEGDTISLRSVISGRLLVSFRMGVDVSSLAFSPDGNTLAGGSRPGTIRLWDAHTGQRKASLTGHSGGVLSLAFSPDGKTLVSADSKTVRLWDVSTGQLKTSLDVQAGWSTSMAFSPDGSILASGSLKGAVRLWDAHTGQQIASTEGHSGRVNSSAFSPDGNTLATGSEVDKTVRLWDVTSGKLQVTLESREGPVYSVAFSSNGNTLASGDGTGILLWDAATGHPRTTLSEHTGPVRSVAFSPDGNTLASGSMDSTVRLWDMATGQSKATLEGHGDEVWSVAFSPDGNTLASGSEDETVRLWDMATGQSKATLEGHGDEVWSVAFSPDGNTLVSGSFSGKETVLVWDVTTGRLRATYSTIPVTSLAFSPDGQTLAASSTGNRFLLWDAATGYLRFRSTIRPSDMGSPSYFSTAFSPYGKILALGGFSGLCQLWDIRGRKRIATLKDLRPVEEGPYPYFDSFTFWSVAFSPDGNTLATASSDGTILLWDMSPYVSPANISAINSEVLAVPAGSALHEPFIVEVRDQVGAPLAGAQVIFTVTSGGGTLSTEAVTTDSSGHARTTLTLGSKPGTNTVTATVGLLDPVTFIVVGVAIPRTLRIVSGGNQQGPVGIPLGYPFVVLVLDQNGEPIPGAVVTFAVTAGDGTLSVETATTDSRGLASSTLTLGSGPGTHTVEVTVADQESVTFSALALATLDFNGDGEINFADFFLFADAFGTTDARFDLDGSGVVDFGDFIIFADAFGQPARAKLLALAAKLIGLPEGPQLRQNMPNPFNSQTVISYFLLAPGPARLELYALTGQRVAVLRQGHQPAGLHRLHWDGHDGEGSPLASGIYLYRLVTAEGALTRKLMLLR